MDRAVVTLCDANYYPGLVQLHASIGSSDPCRVIAYDAGLSADQRADARTRAGLDVLPLPDDSLIVETMAATRSATPMLKPRKRIWPLWICPLLIRAAPARDVFWLDCDVLVLRGLDEMFAMLDDGPVFTPENHAPHAAANLPRLYELLPIARAFDRNVPAVNGGVSGWRHGRDDAVLDAYVRPVAAAAHDPDVMSAIAWHDQGALIWAIQSTGLEHRVLSSPVWNFCVSNAHVSHELMRWDDGLLERARAALPDVRILHWNAHPLPWLTAHAPIR